MHLNAMERRFKELILATAQLLAAAFGLTDQKGLFLFLPQYPVEDFRLKSRRRLGSVLVFVAFMLSSGGLGS